MLASNPVCNVSGVLIGDEFGDPTLSQLYYIKVEPQYFIWYDICNSLSYSEIKKLAAKQMSKFKNGDPLIFEFLYENGTWKLLSAATKF